MQYEQEYHLFQMILRRMRLQSTQLLPGRKPDERVDYGLRRFLGREEEYARSFGAFADGAKDRTLYCWQDVYRLRYLFFRLPAPPAEQVLLVGPYLNRIPTHPALMEAAAQIGLPPQQVGRLALLLERVPVVESEEALLAVVDAFLQCVWKSGDITQMDVNREVAENLSALAASAGKDQDSLVIDRRVLEARYREENQLMEAVSKGLYRQAALILSGVSWVILEPRHSDSLRNVKNYLIIYNTLLRKSAEKGGVPPLELDRQSRAFALKIEALSSASFLKELADEMLRSYCRLVRRQSVGQYSPLVRDTVELIRQDLSADLSLSALAASQNVNASYLSAAFHRETGMTVTDYVLRQRMEQAQYLLTDTRLQIQAIAQNLGISDANYFSKLFKKTTGRTPMEYRSMMQSLTDTAE